ncbi:MAG TPA: hypothetical protein VIG94_06915 [Faecalibacter sp.]
MLNRLIILNSDSYAKADIELYDCNSMQLVGPNNIGKSTLIYALNFLYIIEGNKMVFSGNRSGDKATFNHYFPTFNNSYIIFEIFKQRYYCILVKKNFDGQLEYYKIDHEYREDLFLEYAKDGQILKKFDKVQSEWLTQGIAFKKFTTRRELFNFVYQKGRKNNAVVWLKDEVFNDQREISNNFSKIYRYLIHSQLINHTTLKEALMIADYKDGEFIAFTKKNLKDVRDLQLLNQQLKTLKQIQPIFERFKVSFIELEGLKELIGEVVFNFNQCYPIEFKLLQDEIQLINQELHTIDYNIQQLNLEIKNHLIESGKITEALNQINQKIHQQHQLIHQIKGYESENFMRQSIANLDEDRKKLEAKLVQIEYQELNEQNLSRKLQTLQNQLQFLETQIQSNDSLLLQHISNDLNTREYLNAILSDEIKYLSKENIIKKVNDVEQNLKIFDGEIRLPNDFKTKPLDAIEVLIQRKVDAVKEAEHLKHLLNVAQDLDQYKKELAQVEKAIEELNIKLKQVLDLPRLEKELKDLEFQFNAYQSKEETLKNNQKALENQRSEKQERKHHLKLRLDHLTQEIQQLGQWKIQIESSTFIPYETIRNQSIKELYSNFVHYKEQFQKLQPQMREDFNELKWKLQIHLSSEQAFIDELDQEYAAIDEKQKSIEHLLTNISTQFAIPCHTLMTKLNEFKAFIQNQFNTKIKKIKISDIDALSIEIIPNEKCLKDLQQIAQIRNLDQELVFEEQTENLNVLNMYLEQQRIVWFEELFDFKLHLYRKGKHKIVNLKQQIESDGTDRMIRLVLIMSIIHQIVVNDPENKIVVFIDEIGTIDDSNRISLLDFCVEHHFLPISAAPLHPYDGFDKYYLIRRNEGKIVLSKSNGNVIHRKVLTDE